VTVDVADDIARDVALEVARRHGARVHGAVVQRLGVRDDDDHFLRAAREGALDRLRGVDLLRPLLRADGVAVQRVHHRIPAGALRPVTRRQIHEDVAVRGVAFEIPLERRAVNRDALDRDGLRARFEGRHLRADLRAAWRREQQHQEGNGRGERERGTRRHAQVRW
jgi:hypothetical protein